MKYPYFGSIPQSTHKTDDHVTERVFDLTFDLMAARSERDIHRLIADLIQERTGIEMPPMPWLADPKIYSADELNKKWMEALHYAGFSHIEVGHDPCNRIYFHLILKTATI